MELARLISMSFALATSQISEHLSTMPYFSVVLGENSTSPGLMQTELFTLV
jgi:hypothetical protein